MNWRWIGKRFHATFDVWRKGAKRGPLGLGVRLFFWNPSPGDWSVNVDLLLPVLDLQVGFHGKQKPE